MLDFNEYRDNFRKLYPNYSEEQLKEVFELMVDFWKWMIENFDIFFNTDNYESNNLL